MRKSSPLDAYHRKRDPSRTPEPMGRARRERGRRRFVIQKHRARRLHYDLRLEIDGVLKSWAVPKGPSVDPAVARLAVAVEDHPIEYADFEGEIPAGSYGAGSVIVWDRGTYRLVGPKDPAEQLRDGHLELELRGAKLQGRWLLVRTERGDARQWLLRKRPDPYARGVEPVETRPESVRSGRPLPGDDAADPRAAALRGLPRARVEAAVPPFMLPTLAATPPRGAGWIFEIKWDGMRVLIVRTGGRVRLRSRGGLDVTRQFPEVAAAATRLGGGDLALDAEVVALDPQGRPRFHLLQPRLARAGASGAPATVVAHAYDCLAVLGRDVRGLPLRARKEIVRSLVGDGGALRYCDHVEDDGPAVLASVAALGLEGVVAKRADARYRAGRRPEWVKVKCHRRQEFVIGGYTDPKGTRPHLGALHLGVYEGRRLTYVGRVGSGLDDAGLGRLAARLRALATPRCPFAAGAPPSGLEHHWVRPRLVCEVRFGEWTPDGRIRHPVFLGLRADRAPASVGREEAPAPPVSGGRRRSAAAAPGSAPPRPRRRPRSGG